MSWLEGEIREFAGNDPKKAELRKIRTEPDQDWSEMYFFHVEQARGVGYPDPALAAGRRIEFRPLAGASRPRVGSFKPFEGPTGPPRRAAAGDRHFLNPYHFIPLRAPTDETLTPFETLRNETVLHHRFGSPSLAEGKPPLYSGRILCQLETEGAVVIGSSQDQPERNEDRETLVSPYELPDPTFGDGGASRPAVPGSSLRGLISSLVEAASCSAMRVLGDASYTRRALVGKTAQEGLSAIGMLVREKSALRLRPLTMSLAEMKGSSDEPPETGCRVLVGEYRKRGDRLEPVSGSFLERKPLSWSASNQGEFWYCDLTDAEWYPRESRLRIGIRPKREPISEAEWKKLDQTERDRYTRGILLVVGLDGSKAENLPKNKKFEFFLPYPKGKKGDARPTLEIEPAALEEVKALLADAAQLPRGGQDQDYPYLHRGRKRDPGWLEPRPGDLVYYEKGQKTRRVSRLAYTAIWRRPVQGGLWDAVSSGVSPDLVPFHPGRDRVTLAERLFGFVEQKDDGDRGNRERRQARALAGRVRFSHALVVGDKPENGWYEPETTLKILASPKPPSPALYFGNEKRNGKALAKNQLDLREHKLQGRKVYLHHREEDVAARCYETGEPDKNRKQKLRVKPLCTETRFLFHVDFHNLERAELGHLLYALRPTEAFRHKLGLGKPIDLGRVRIDPLAVAHLDPAARYRPEGLFGPRYAAAEWLDASVDWDEAGETLRFRYRDERKAASGDAAANGVFPRASVLAEETRKSMPPAVRGAIEQVGDPAQVDLEVTYPVVEGQTSEGEHFKWFVANDRYYGERLEPLSSGEPLPALKRHPERPRGRGGRRTRR